MSLKTHSLIFYGFNITADNQNLDFQEGGGPLLAVITIGAYSLSDFASEVSKALNAAGSLIYSVAVDRPNRRLVISASGNFTILAATGSHLGTTGWGVVGFIADTGPSNAITAPAFSAGSAYNTQFILQDHVDPEDFQDSTYGTVNKSASGKVEVVSYGVESFMKADFQYLNNNDHGAGAPVRYNATGVQQARLLMRFFVTKAPFEFMQDESNPASFIKLMLESTPEDSKGLKYMLKEQYGRGLPGYFNTGTLVFRVLE